MAQNIDIAGAQYSAVPSINVPKHGGGTASFIDVTGTTATSSDVMTGKQFYTSNGVLTQGTAVQGQTYTEEPNSAGGNTAIITGGLELSPAGVYNKASYNGSTLIDLSADTVTADQVSGGKTFHLATGEQAVGTYSPSVETATFTPESNSLTATFNVSRKPVMFACNCTQSQISNSTTRTIAKVIAADEELYGLTYYQTGSSGRVVYITEATMSWSYSNGTLTITSGSSSNAGYFRSGYPYVLIYI